MTNILISIGNSDDKLSQARWADFIADVRAVLTGLGGSAQVHGEWFSAPDKPWQNANWCVELTDPLVARGALRAELRWLAERYQQDSIAWTEGEIEFLSAKGVYVSSESVNVQRADRRDPDEQEMTTP